MRKNNTNEKNTLTAVYSHNPDIFKNMDIITKTEMIKVLNKMQEYFNLYLNGILNVDDYNSLMNEIVEEWNKNNSKYKIRGYTEV